MADDPDDAQALRGKRTRARQRKVKAELEPQGLQAGASFDAKVDAKAELIVDLTARERRGRGKPPKSETASKARKARELANQPEFRHSTGMYVGKPFIAKIAREIPWSEPAVSRALKKRHK
jgi:hypothetical protein